MLKKSFTGDRQNFRHILINLSWSLEVSKIAFFQIKVCKMLEYVCSYPVDTYLIKVNNGNTRLMC